MGIWNVCINLALVLATPDRAADPEIGSGPEPTLSPAPVPQAAPASGQANLAVLPAQRIMVDFALAAAAVPDLRYGYPRADDGLFYLEAQVNGVPVRFLVDTGATSVVLTERDAQRAGVGTTAGDTPLLADTAGGKVAMTWSRARQLIAGPVSRSDVDVAVTSGGLEVSLLGQSWLSQYSAVMIRGDRLILQP